MAVRRPTLDQLRSVAEDLGMHMGEEELKSYDALMQGNYAAYDIVDAMPDYVPAVNYPRTPGYRPEGEENKYNAWYVKTTVKGAASGKLAGKTVALKDNVCLAGVPMMNGASTLEGYVPDVDATIVTRILDAGGTIVGKTHCEYFCFSGGSHTNATGPVHNPHKMGYSAGGSSSGSGVVVALGEADMAIGGDQGGSIRIPVVVLRHLRHEGDARPRALYRRHADRNHARPHRADDRATSRDNALLLEVLAGADGLDPRQIAPKVAELHRSARRRRQGIAHRHRQGRLWASRFPSPTSTPRSWRAPQLFKKLGATVDEISVPMHLLGPAIWLPIAAEGAHRVHDEGQRHGHQLARSLQHDAARRAFRLAPSRRRTVRQPEDHHAARPLFHQALSRPFLCQGAEPEPQAARRL